jgi:hypothetical protein
VRGHETLKIGLVFVFDCIYARLLPAPVQNIHFKKTPANFAMRATIAQSVQRLGYGLGGSGFEFW